jgi:hypothetical protein
LGGFVARRYGDTRTAQLLFQLCAESASDSAPVSDIFRSPGSSNDMMMSFPVPKQVGGAIPGIQTLSIFELGLCRFMCLEIEDAIRIWEKFIFLGKQVPGGKFDTMTSWCYYLQGNAHSLLRNFSQASECFEKTHAHVRPAFTYDVFSSRKAKEFHAAAIAVSKGEGGRRRGSSSGAAGWFASITQQLSSSSASDHQLSLNFPGLSSIELASTVGYFALKSGALLAALEILQSQEDECRRLIGLLTSIGGQASSQAESMWGSLWSQASLESCCEPAPKGFAAPKVMEGLRPDPKINDLILNAQNGTTVPKVLAHYFYVRGRILMLIAYRLARDKKLLPELAGSDASEGSEKVQSLTIPASFLQLSSLYPLCDVSFIKKTLEKSTAISAASTPVGNASTFTLHIGSLLSSGAVSFDISSIFLAKGKIAHSDYVLTIEHSQVLYSAFIETRGNPTNATFECPPSSPVKPSEALTSTFQWTLSDPTISSNGKSADWASLHSMVFYGKALLNLAKVGIVIPNSELVASSGPAASVLYSPFLTNLSRQKHQEGKKAADKATGGSGYDFDKPLGRKITGLGEALEIFTGKLHQKGL